ncbi:hypothetical protein A1O1_00212 [Capronia coronata CBS 617.96]|uniref:Uncharacterized protein n=1 Tax=Capronia coronata CBS 617.96 TaxID=1182541 RepID=W9YRB3_9EURO|nr:uncharacterized protein A1O1_00212 [Capronia coronata CBS 617.96]EXJ95093.1 hypothetical protein A1O1_00212 [Capronia coronata CBS 617.96]
MECHVLNTIWLSQVGGIRSRQSKSLPVPRNQARPFSEDGTAGREQIPTWYNRAADRSPTTERIQHHLAVLARPNIVRQQFHYSKALTSGIPFVNARNSIMLLFSPFLEKSELAIQKYPRFENSFVTAGGVLFTRGWIHEYCVHATQYISELDSHISRTGSNWKVQGWEIALTLVAWLFDFGTDENFLWEAFRTHRDKILGSNSEKQADSLTDIQPVGNPQVVEDIHRALWSGRSTDMTGSRQALAPTSDRPGAKFSSAHKVTAYVLPVWSTSISIRAGKVGDRNILPFIHLTLAFLWSSSFVIKKFVPGGEVVVSPLWGAREFPRHNQDRLTRSRLPAR